MPATRPIPTWRWACSTASVRDCALRIKGEAYDRDEAPPRGDVRIPGLPGLPAIADETQRPPATGPLDRLARAIR